MYTYLTLSKVLRDSVALLRAHFLPIALMYAVVAAPNFFIDISEDMTLFQSAYLVVIFLVATLVHFLSIRLASTSFLYNNFSIIEDIKSSLNVFLAFAFLSILGQSLSIMGLFLLIFPGLIAAILFSLAKIHFVTTSSNIKGAILGTLKLLNRQQFLQIIKIMAFPFAILLLVTQTVLAIVQDQALIFKYLPLAIIVINPIAVCYSVSIYFNLIKENQLEPTN